jgi:hypothetical protein
MLATPHPRRQKIPPSPAAYTARHDPPAACPLPPTRAALHETFLCDLEVGCFLHEHAERVHEALVSMAQMALQLRALVDGRVRTSARALGQGFDACHAFLARVLHELASNDATSSQPAALLVALDFNEYYQTDMFV